MGSRRQWKESSPRYPRSLQDRVRDQLYSYCEGACSSVQRARTLYSDTGGHEYISQEHIRLATYFRWSGSSWIRQTMQGRVVLVHIGSTSGIQSIEVTQNAKRDHRSRPLGRRRPPRMAEQLRDMPWTADLHAFAPIHANTVDTKSIHDREYTGACFRVRAR